MQKKVVVFALFSFVAFLPATLVAQQTFGTVTGKVADASGAVVQNADVTITNNGTGLQQSVHSKGDGSYSVSDLPIGTYTVTVNHAGFKKEVHSQVLVQANRTTTLDIALQPGTVETVVQVTGTPLLNHVDTTNGYILNSQQIEQIPLGTGSFTQMAILSPGINADLLAGADTNAGLGNQSIWANGQRDTSNSITINSVSANNLFNGKTSSQVAGNRNVLNTGENFLAGGQIQTNTSVYDAIGQAIPSPPQETIEELRVNTSMYDASQGANSGAHVDILTKSGTNKFHGQVYGYRQTDALNAAPFFFKNDPNIPASDKVPKLHRGILGATLGGPIVKNKLFFFGSYQWTSVHDQLNGFQNVTVPTELTDDRSVAGLTALATVLNGGTPPAAPLDPVAVKLLQFKLPSGQLMIPSAQITDAAQADALGFTNTLIAPPSTFTAHQANANIDYNFRDNDQIYAKYYFQDDPTTSPFSNMSNLLGFPQDLKTGSQAFSLDNTHTFNPNLAWEQKLGFVRQRVFSTTGQSLTAQDAGINLFGSTSFPGINIDQISDPATQFVSGNSLGFGPISNFANTGSFQNQWEFTSNLNWVAGRHTLSFGGNFDYTQLNVINRANNVAGVDFRTFEDFLVGNVRPGLDHSVLFSGASSRYYRADQLGTYAQDKIRLTSNVNVTLGLRYDWDGPLSEKFGRLVNFDPRKYQYDFATDTIVNDGLVVAGNNKQFRTPGTSDSTLTGRQWGIAPRIGVAWSPSFIPNFVVRSGFGIYLDRGEFFAEFSPSAGFGFNGPFGVTLQPPFVVSDPAVKGATFSNPFGTMAPSLAGSNPASFASQLPNIAALETGTDPYLFGGYDPRNKLPYSENWNLDIQWQPRNDMVFTAAYIGNHGLHETLPIPFNQPQVATPQNPINGQIYSYGYNVTSTEPLSTSTGGNTDIRVPFIGYSPNSVFYEAEGISWYHALQTQLSKRFSHGLQGSISYTWSHSTDEGSGLGLFYNGNNPLDPKSGYANSDFDRTHVVAINYVYDLPKVAALTGIADKLLNGWGISGVAILESGQPYNVYDFSGAVASIFYSNNDFLTNPVVPLAPGFTPGSAQTGHLGTNPNEPALNPSAFTIPLLQPGQDGVPPCDATGGPNNGPLCDTFESGFATRGRNIFRGSFQKRADLSIVKQTTISERLQARYSFDIFNLTNTPSFDTPNNNVSFSDFGNPPNFSFPPSGDLGVVQHSIGSPRLIRMSLHFIF
ncbi:MAG TPA: carboxypeptidase regulatory-like domain-containing protein [Terriglobales bacterium]|nr:carboxypeptidase regulatory-like domain-containing protein [Terriglobales bacterium]